MPVSCASHYINDLSLFIKDSIIDMFADDTTITYMGKSKPDITQTLQNEICHIGVNRTQCYQKHKKQKLCFCPLHTQ